MLRTLLLVYFARAAAEAERSPLLFRAPLAVRVVLIGFDVREDGAPAISADDVRSLLEAALPFRTPSVLEDAGGAAPRARPLALEYALRYSAVELGEAARSIYEDIVRSALRPARARASGRSARYPRRCCVRPRRARRPSTAARTRARAAARAARRRPRPRARSAFGTATRPRAASARRPRRSRARRPRERQSR